MAAAGTVLVDDGPTDDTACGTTTRAARAFRVRLAVIVAVAVAVRAAYVWFVRRGEPVNGDAFYYHSGANLLADGEGFIEPFTFRETGMAVQAADHPPLYVVYLAAFSVLGFDSPTWHMAASVLLGAATVVLLALLGRRLAGDAVGLVAAAIGALYPNVWVYDGFILSESLAMLVVVGFLFLAYRWRASTRWPDYAWLGAVAALAALTRAELQLLTVLVILPMALAHRTLALRRRIGLVAAGALGFALVSAPWVAHNLTRFETPVLVSGGLEPTLAVSYCDSTFEGRYLGYWDVGCAVRVPEAAPPGIDRSELFQRYRDTAFEFIGDNLGRLPVVVAARIGRVTGLYRPAQQVDFDVFPEGRERWIAWTAAVSWYALAALAVVGAVRLRRRGVPLYPLLALPVTVLVAVVVTFATIRYRAVAEPVVAVLAAVAVVGFVQSRRGRARADRP